MKVPKSTDLTIDTETLQKVQCPYKFKLPGSSKVRVMDVQQSFRIPQSGQSCNFSYEVHSLEIFMAKSITSGRPLRRTSKFFKGPSARIRLESRRSRHCWLIEGRPLQMLQRYEAAPTPPKILSHHQQHARHVGSESSHVWQLKNLEASSQKISRKGTGKGKAGERRNMRASLQVQCCREQNRKLRSCTEHGHHQKWTPSGKTKRVHSRSFLNFVGIRIRQMPPALQENSTETGLTTSLARKEIGLTSTLKS